MAVANFSGQYGHNMTLDVYSAWNSPDIANNRSVVNVQAVLRTNGYASMWGVRAPMTIHVDGGGAIEYNTVNIGANSSQLLFARDYVIGHNADGSKTVNISFKVDLNTAGYGSATVNFSVRLSDIPRASSVSVGDGTIGKPVTITINRQSSSFKHTLRYAWGNKSGTIATNVDASTTWTVPNDFANNIPNSTSGTGTIYVDTYSGGTKTGTRSTTFTASVPDSMKPTFTGLTLTDTNTAAKALLGGNNFLQIISNIKVDFNGASGSYGSTIKGYRAEIVNKNLATNSNGGTLGVMNFNGSATIRASVVDSRGRRSDTKDVTINVIQYFAPSLSFTAYRARETPSTIQIVRNAKIAPITISGKQKNTMTLSFKVAPLGSKTFTTDNGSASGSWTTINSLSNSAANMANSYSASKSFTVIGTLSDKFTSTEFSATVSTESVVISYDKDSRLGVGKIADNSYKAGSLDVKGDIYANNKPIQQHQLTNNDGGAIRKDNQDYNNLTETGFYVISSGTNCPAGVLFAYLSVVAHEVKGYCYQRCVDRQSQREFFRVCEGTVWKDWVELGKARVETGWQSAGYAGTYYKRSGDVLAIRYHFTGNGSNMNFGTIPSSVWVPSQEYMQVIAKWSIDGGANTHVQINNGSGGLNALFTEKGMKYTGELLLMI